MLRTLFFSDTHFTKTAEFSKPTSDGLTEYLQTCLLSIQFVKQVAVDVKPDLLVFGGDFWNAHDYIDIMALNAGHRGFELFDDLGCEKIAVVGNHDYFNIERGIHSLRFLQSSGWKVYEDVGMFTKDQVNVVVLPFRKSYPNAYIKDLVEEVNPHLVLTHCDVVGGKRRAVLHENDTKAYSPRGLDPDLFKSCSIVLNGHYHHPCNVTGNWVNTGGLTTRTFHDKFSAPRGVVVVDVNEDGAKIQRFTNPHNKDFVEYEIESEEDITKLASTDHSNSYAKLMYDVELESEVLALQDFFAGTRLVPRKLKARTEYKRTQDLSLSLEDTLVEHLKGYHGSEELTPLALEVLREAMEGYNEGVTREPLEFGVLRLENFYGVEELEFDLYRRGVVLVTGENRDDPGEENNGAGKSTLLEAIFWILTGKSLRGFKSKEVIRWGANYVYGSLELYVGNRKYKLVRTRKHPTLKTGVKLFLGDDDITTRLSSDTEDVLSSILGRSEKHLKHICVMKADALSSFTSLSTGQRYRAIEEIIDCEPYREARVISAQLRLEATLELSEVQGRLDEVLKRQSELKTMITHQEERLKASLDLTAPKREELTENIEELRLGLAEKEKELEDLEASITKLSEDHSVLSSKQLQYSASLSPVSSRRTTKENDIENVRRKLEEYKQLSTGSCPTCGSTFTACSFRDEIAEAEWELQNLTVEHEELTKEEEARSVRLNALGKAAGEIQLKAEEQRKRKNKAKLERDGIDRAVRELLAERDSLPSADVAKAKLEAYEEELSVCIEKAHKLSHEESAIVVKARNVGILEDEVFAEDGVRKDIIAKVGLPYLNSKLEEQAQGLYGGRELYIDEDLQTRMAGNHTYVSNSTGQRRKVDLSIHFSLRDLAVATGRSRIGFLGLDEVLDPLDDAGIYAAKEVLDAKAEDATVLMITHSKYAASISTNSVRMIKENGIVRMEDSV